MTKPIIDSFAFGFILASAVWFGLTIYGRSRKPRWRGKLRGKIWDHETGQSVVHHIISSEGRIPWVACAQHLKTGQMELVMTLPAQNVSLS
jgi:hypothetical protein